MFAPNTAASRGTASSMSSAPELMRLLANGQGDDQPIEAGECSVSGLAALMAIQENKEISDAINLNHNSRVLVFGTEGATDPSIYKAIIIG